MLTHSPRTRAQLERSLHRKEYPGEVVEKVLNGLDEAGLIDDAAFAQAWVNSRQYSRHLSRRALTQELRTRGVEEETVREAVAEVSDEDEQDGARALARKSLRGSRTKDKEARIRRALGVLARKGYPGASPTASSARNWSRKASKPTWTTPASDPAGPEALGWNVWAGGHPAVAQELRARLLSRRATAVRYL